MRVKPELDLEGGWYSDDTLGRTDRFQGNFETKVGLRTRYGIWRVYDTPGWRTIKRLKHTTRSKILKTYLG